MNAVNGAADAGPAVVRVSMDAKATVKSGPFLRGDTSRVVVQAADHHVHPAGTVTPVGIFLPKYDELCIYQVTSKVPSDCLVDRLCPWWEAVRARFAHLNMVVLNLTREPQPAHPVHVPAGAVRGPGRDLGAARLLPAVSRQVQRYRALLGILALHWNGSLLDSLEAVLGYTASMTWKGLQPVVELVTTTYQTGVRRTKAAMAEVEAHLDHPPHLGKWFVDILYQPPASSDA